MGSQLKPYDSSKSKTKQMREMFDRISPRYDFLNHVLSFGIDIAWRNSVVHIARKVPNGRFLDIATGTADQAIALAQALHPQRIDAVDLSEKMMEIGQKKVDKKGLSDTIFFQKADCQNLPFEHSTFDLVTISFGIRNFENLAQSLSEIRRVLKPGGMVLILEFSSPQTSPMKQLYGLYNKLWLPLIGWIFSGDRRAYTYLPKSIEGFPYGDKFMNLMRVDGFTATRFTPMTGGIATVYSAIK